MQIVRTYEGNIAENFTDQRLQTAFRVKIGSRQARTMQHAINAIHAAFQRNQPFAPLLHKAIENGLFHRAIGLRHGEQDGAGFPGAAGIHGRNEARHFSKRGGGSGPRIGHNSIARDQAARFKIPQSRRGRKAVAFNGKAQKGNARPGHQMATPKSSAMRGVDFSPVPVSTTTVVSSARMVPASSNFTKAAAAWAQVGST